MEEDDAEQHPGFKAVAGAVAHHLMKQHSGMSPESAESHAGAIIGYAKAHASGAAKKANPNLTHTAGYGE